MDQSTLRDGRKLIRAKTRSIHTDHNKPTEKSLKADEFFKRFLLIQLCTYLNISAVYFYTSTQYIWLNGLRSYSSVVILCICGIFLWKINCSQFMGNIVTLKCKTRTFLIMVSLLLPSGLETSLFQKWWVTGISTVEKPIIWWEKLLVD